MKSYLANLNNPSQSFELSENNNNLNMFVNQQVATQLSSTPAVVNSNALNHWQNVGDLLNGQVPINTTLSGSEVTLYDWKTQAVALSYDNYMEELPNITREVLRLLLYVEKGKEWEFPINPLNIIYDKNTNRCSVFYRYPHTLKNSDESYMSTVFKMIFYLYTPNTDMSTQDFGSDFGIRNSRNLSVDEASAFYYKYNYPQSPDKASEEYIRLVSTYGEQRIAQLATDAIDVTKGADTSFGIEDLLNNNILNGGDIISEVNNDNTNYINLATTNIPTHNNSNVTQYPNNGQNQHPQNRPNNHVNNSNNKKGHPFLIGIVILALLGGGGYWFMTHNKQSNNSSPSDNTTSTKNSKSPKNNEDFYDGLLSSAANSNNASSYFDKYFANGGSQNDLSKQELAAVFAAYLKDNKYNSILKNIGSERTANALVKYLISKNDNDAIKKLNGGNYKIVQFAQADLDNNQDKMVSLANDVDLSDNQKYQADLCKAFADTGNLSKGKSWANSQSNSTDLINAIKNDAYQEPNADKDKINSDLGVN